MIRKYLAWFQIKALCVVLYNFTLILSEISNADFISSNNQEITSYIELQTQKHQT